MSARLTIRRAQAADAGAVIALIEALADYEKLTPPGDAARERLRRDIAEGRRFSVLLAESGGEAIGYALFFETYSTFLGLPKLYLEDIFVRPQSRSTGAGIALFRAVCREALARGCGALEWEVLDWNRLALDFYELLGAKHSRGWLPYRLDREGIEAVAAEEPAVKE